MKIVDYLKSKFMDFDCFFGAVNNLKPIKISKIDYNRIKEFFDSQEKEIALKILEKKSQQSLGQLPTPKTIFPTLGEKISDNGDYLGCTFVLNNAYFKGIKSEANEAFKDLYLSGILQIFADYGFIPKFNISDYYTNEYPYFIEIETIQKVSLESLSFERIVELSVFVSFLQQILKSQGYSLQDPNIENFCYSVNHPYYLDFGSFEHKFHHHKEYSLVISLIYQIVLSYFPNSIFHDYYIFGTETNWNSNKKNNIYKYNKIEVRKIAKRFVAYHKLHSSHLVYRAAKRVIKHFDCRPEDLFILFSDVDKLNEFDFLNYK